MAKPKPKSSDLIFTSNPRPSRKASDHQQFTGANREAAKFLGLSPENFDDPGFCLLCGEGPKSCECGDF